MNSESEPRKDTPRSVRRIVLPSGRTMEAVTYGRWAEEDLTTVAGLLKYVAYKNMADEIDRFVAALDSDDILPEDIAGTATPRHLERYERLYGFAE
jgi:hypothetical protein